MPDCDFWLMWNVCFLVLDCKLEVHGYDIQPLSSIIPNRRRPGRPGRHWEDRDDQGPGQHARKVRWMVMGGRDGVNGAQHLHA